jgi:hypothetical protein
MRLVTGTSGNGAVFAYAPGRFFHVTSPDHLAIGHKLGLWNSDTIPQVSDYELDMTRDCAIGNGEGKCDNIGAGQSPSNING